MKSAIKKYGLIIFSFCVIACLSDIFIIHTHVLFSTDDIQFHIKRIMELYNGNYSPFAFNYFHGSSIMAMYPHISLYPMALLIHLTRSYIKSYYYFFILIILTSLFISFLSSLKYSKSLIVSYLFAILYNLSISFLINYFHDADLGITISLVFLPMAIFGFLDILNGSKNYIKLVMGITFMTFCQLPTTVITCAFLLIMLLLNVHKVNKIKLFVFIKSTILTILLTAIVWVPLLHVLILNKMYTPGSSQIQSASLLSIIKNVGVLSIIIAFVLLFYLKKLNRLTKQLYWVSIIIIISSSTLIPIIKYVASINLFEFLNKFQFTARFLIIPQVVLCYLTAWLIGQYLKKIKHFKLLFIGIMIIIILLQMSVQLFIVHKEFNQNYRCASSYQSIEVNNLSNRYLIKTPWVKYLYNGYINNKDYYPIKSISKVSNINNNEAIYNHNQTINVKHTGYNQFLFNSPKKINKLILPILHYNDEHLHVYLNHSLVNHYSNKNDLIVLKNVKKGKNIVKIAYIPNTWSKLLKNMLFLIGIVWLFMNLMI